MSYLKFLTIFSLVLPNLMMANDKSIQLDPSRVLKSHNSIRSFLKLPSLKWSNKLETEAKMWSRKLALGNKCEIKHHVSSRLKKYPYGENLYWGSPRIWLNGKVTVKPVSIELVVKRWSQERVNFNYEENSCKDKKLCGHFTQLVWKDTTEVGCAMTVCPSKGQIWVCTYNPPGNHVGQRPY